MSFRFTELLRAIIGNKIEMADAKNGNYPLNELNQKIKNMGHKHLRKISV